LHLAQRAGQESGEVCLRKLKPQDISTVVGEMPAFAVREAEQGWQVCITWPDGVEGPSIGFVSKSDAETWIVRDARDWLGRLKSSHNVPSRLS
jgi:hypothetical protein